MRYMPNVLLQHAKQNTYAGFSQGTRMPVQKELRLIVVPSSMIDVLGRVTSSSPFLEIRIFHRQCKPMSSHIFRTIWGSNRVANFVVSMRRIPSGHNDDNAETWQRNLTLFCTAYTTDDWEPTFEVY
jgi:hypothetical protein